MCAVCHYPDPNKGPILRFIRVKMHDVLVLVMKLVVCALLLPEYYLAID